MKSSIKIAAIYLFLIATLPLWATDYYVDVNKSGSSGDGLTLATAKKTLQEAANLSLVAGDVVNVKGGTYTVTGSQAIMSINNRSGNASNYITIRNVAGETPKIEFAGYNGIELIGSSSYIEINGFEIQGYKGASDTRTVTGAEGQYSTYSSCSGLTIGAQYTGNGIFVKDADNNFTTDNSHHIRILNCKIHDCGGGGIAMSGVDYVTIENNEVYRNAWYSTYANSGISVYQPYNFDAGTGYKIFIRNNKSYLNDSKIKWSSGCVYSDGNGIILDDYRNTQNTSAYGIYAGKTLVANNITFGNGGSGIHAFSSNNIDIVHNVSYQNGQRTTSTPPTGGYNDGGIYGNATTNVQIINNIVVGIAGRKINSNSSNSSHVIASNIFFGGTGLVVSGTGIIAASSTGNSAANPLFVNPSIDPSVADFQLQTTSPAINSAAIFSAVTTDFNGSTRPQGAGPDRGAYEVAGTIPVELLYFKAAALKNGNLLTWATATEINTIHFDMERSTDGKTFETIGKTKAKGHHSTYEFTDESPLWGLGGVYYRLKINDLDGKITFSKIVNISAIGKGSVKIYPSVSNGVLTVEGAKSFDIINPFGQVVLSGKAVINQASINISHLTNGLYVVRGVDTEGSDFAKKIIKQ